MKVLSVQTNSIQDKDFKLHKPEGREHFLFVLFKTPTMLLTDNEYKPIKPETGIFFDKHKIQSYYPCNSQTFNHDFLFFDLEDEKETISFDSIPKETIHNVLLPEEITSILQEIENVYSKPSDFRTEMLSNLGTVFFI